MTKSDEAKKTDAELKDVLKRKHLLARVAGNIASGIVTAPTKATADAKSIAAVSVDVAEEILKKIEL